MRLHVDVLGWLHVVWGVFAALAGASLIVLAIGGRVALLDVDGPTPADQAAIWLCAGAGLVLLAFGAANAAVGRSLHGRRAFGRASMLVLGVPNLVIVPFGTALGVYTYWVLLNDDARRQFGRPARSQPVPVPTEREQ